MGLRTSSLLFILPCICPFFFLSIFFVKDISTTIKDRKFIVGIQNNNDKFSYHGINNRFCPVCSSLYLLSFLSLILSLHAINTSIFVIDFSTTVQDRRLICCVSIDNDLLRCGIENRHSPVYSSLYMFFFSFCPYFVKYFSTTI